MADIAKRGAAAGTTTSLVDLGWVQKGDLDLDLEKASWDLPLGGVTAPIRGKGGLHIIKLSERRAAVLRGFDDVKEQVAAKIEQSRMAAEFRKYLRELEERSYIALKVPPEAEGFKGLSSIGEEEVPGTGTSLGDVPAQATPTAAPAAPAAGGKPAGTPPRPAAPPPTHPPQSDTAPPPPPPPPAPAATPPPPSGG
jgi:hypothetical protein